MADYVFAIAPDWDGTIETLLLGAKVTTLFTNHQLEKRLARPCRLNAPTRGSPRLRV